MTRKVSRIIMKTVQFAAGRSDLKSMLLMMVIFS